MQRRDFLGLAVGWALTRSGLALPVATPHQTEGPFYPIEAQADTDTDLTLVLGHKRGAQGQVLHIAGQLRDLDGQVLPGAEVEIWQACASGRYHHPSDPNPAALDPDFQYWGKLKTDKQGRYALKTIKPGTYPAAPGWVRPSHIHFKVKARGYPQLVTQMYFEGDGLIARDGIIQALSREQQRMVIVPFDSKGQGKFDIVLGRSGRYSHRSTPLL